MSLEELFQSPEDRIADFFKIQTLLYRHDPSLQDYFMPLQLAARASRTMVTRRASPFQRVRQVGLEVAEALDRLRPRRKIKTDVLFCPLQYFGRKTENRFLLRILLGLVQTDAKVLCLMPWDTVFRNELERELSAAGRRGQVEFLDPLIPTGRIEARLARRMARMRGISALETAVSILEPAGLAPDSDATGAFEHTASFIEAWERLAQDVEFDAIVARCHWHSLCSPVCRTGRERGKQVITFQQGVIGHSLDAPVTASKYVAFGPCSAKFLSNVNHVFFEACGLSAPPVTYVEAGSLYDTVAELPNQFGLRTVLMVDEPITHGEFYGVVDQNRAMLRLAEKLLTSGLPLRRLIIRPHPFWNDLDFRLCLQLIREHPMQCELSHPAWSLEDDMNRSSIAIGVFSGVLTVTSACGLPTYFIRTVHGYATGDFGCFYNSQGLLPDDTFQEISRLLLDQDAYDEARLAALRNARQYYKDGGNAKLDGEFFKDLLAVDKTNGTYEANLL